MGSRGLLYSPAGCCAGDGTAADGAFFWSRDKESPAIKHLVAQGFAVMYTVILFTTTNNMLFLYVFPMIVVISVYNDKAYALKVNIGVVIENLLVVILGAATGRFGFRDISSGVIQILAVLLFCAYSYIAAATSETNSREKLQQVKDAQGETEKVLGDVSRNADVMRRGINEIHAKSGATAVCIGDDQGRDGTGNHRRDGHGGGSAETAGTDGDNRRESRACQYGCIGYYRAHGEDAFCAGKRKSGYGYPGGRG